MPSTYDYLQNQRKIRQVVHAAKRETLDAENMRRDEVLDYFDGIDSHEILRGKYAARYAYRLAKDTDSESGSETYKYAKGLAPNAVQEGFYQVCETKTLQRVVRSIATLFTQPDQRFSFTGVEPLPDSVNLLTGFRDAGGFLKELIRTDRVSVLLGSAAMRISHQGGRLRYHGGTGPQCVWLVWPESIIEDGQERSPDKSDIEDAAIVIVRLEDSTDAQTSFKNSKYIAYFGRSAELPYGRCVIYWASNPYEIPPIGSDGVIEYEMENIGPCNPLSALQELIAEGMEICPCEYPIIVIHGQDVSVSHVFPPTAFSLYDNAIEMDLLQSRLLKAADVAARGSVAVFMDSGGIPPENPDEGVCIMPRGSRREIAAIPSSGVIDGSEALKLAQLQIATGYGVPGYEVVSDAQGAPESGVALAIRSQPKKEGRIERINATRQEIARMYHIERGLMRWFGGEQQAIPADVEQIWYPGEWAPPMSATEKTAEIQAKYDLGVIDFVEAVRLSHSLEDRQSARDLLDSWAQDARMYGGPNERTALRVPPRNAAKLGLP